MTAWLAAFVFTQCVEMPLYARALGRARRARWLLAFGASAITHPVVWFVMPGAWEALYLRAIDAHPAWVIASPGWRYASLVALAETFAVLVEAVYLRLLGVKRAFVWSLGANAASVTLGLVSRAVFGWP